MKADLRENQIMTTKMKKNSEQYQIKRQLIDLYRETFGITLAPKEQEKYFT